MLYTLFEGNFPIFWDFLGIMQVFPIKLNIYIIKPPLESNLETLLLVKVEPIKNVRKNGCSSFSEAYLKTKLGEVAREVKFVI